MKINNMKKPKDALKNIFGYREFRENQEILIERILNKQDTVIIMPTGGGKSLCYQLPAILFQGSVIVVSPLISLMIDQVTRLKELGISAVYLNSSLSKEEFHNNMRMINEHKIDLIYAAPETLMIQKTIHLLKNIHIDLIAIDEAHCISEWGHDFRPEYRKLNLLREYFPSAALIALTATATPKVRNDIYKNLSLNNGKIFCSGFDRKNLYLEVISKNDPYRQTVEFLDQFSDQSGIIYCFSRKQVDNLCKKLQKDGYSVLPYHAGLSSGERDKNQLSFIKDNTRIIVATIAFGMGIDKPDIRFTLHYDLPKSIESYYQQIGRAGRDGEPAFCRLLFSPADIAKIDFIIKDSDNYQVNRVLLNHLVDYCENPQCRRKIILSYFGETYQNENCGNCDNCLNENRAQEDISEWAQKFLSCVVRTQQIYGASYLIQILRGSKSSKIMNHYHDRLSVYGIGKDISSKQWNYLIRQFRRQGLFMADDYGSIKITQKAVSVLKGNIKIFGTFTEEKLINRQQNLDEYDIKLFKILQKLRKEIADEMNFPPYVIFPDRTLKEMSCRLPQKNEDLDSIYGIGLQKKKKYGNIFLQAVKNYCTENHVKITKNYEKKSIMDSETYNKYVNDFINGTEIRDIAKNYQIKEATVINHLEKYVLAGNILEKKIPINLSLVETNEIISIFKKTGFHRLKPIFDYFNGKYSYDVLRIIRINAFQELTNPSSS